MKFSPPAVRSQMCACGSAEEGRKSLFRLQCLPASFPVTQAGLIALLVVILCMVLGCGSASSRTTAIPSASSVNADSAQSSSAYPMVQAFQADSFVNSIGVVTHLTYSNTLYYTAWPQILSALQSLGVRHIRDGFYNWPSGSPFYAEHQQLSRAGIRTDYVVPFSEATTPESIEELAPQVEDMEAIEAPNECDVAGNCGSTILNGIADMLGFLPSLDQAGQQLGVPVLGPALSESSTYSTLGNLSSKMQYNNLHVYFGGRNPGSAGWGAPDANGNQYGSLAYWLDQANTDAPNVPAMITETGYMSFPGLPIPWTVPENVEASYIPRTLLLAYKAGIPRTYIYELLDEISSPGYGLLHSDLTPKPAYTAVQSLIANLADPGAAFSPGKLGYAIQGGGSSLNQILFQKRDGSFWLVLWLEQSSFNPATYASTPVTPEQVTLQLDSGYAVPNVGTLSTSGNLSWSSSSTSGSVPLTISDQPTVVKILPQ